MRVPEPLLALIAGISLCAGCARDAGPPPPGNAERGRQAMEYYGCGACHVIPGIPGARGGVGPPLHDYARRPYVAGSLPNSPELLARFLADPTVFRPGSAMPDLGVDAATAADMAAWLLRQP